MRLFLVRHGETVDNVAGIYAGIRDSALTTHGVLQARRLAAHLASATAPPIQHVFSSDLNRAVNTAQAIVDAHQLLPLAVTVPAAGPASSSAASRHEYGIPDASSIQLVKVPDLREKNFGSTEGKRFGAPRADDSETREEMQVRAERFVVDHLDPLLNDMVRGVKPAASIVVVSHGIFLNSLLRVLLARYAPLELARLAKSGPGQSADLASWGNTGYVEAVFVGGTAGSLSASASSTGGTLAGSAVMTDALPAVTLTVAKVNALDHLDGLKKTRGGIGSAQFDRRQRTVDSFFRPVTRDPEGGQS